MILVNKNFSYPKLIYNINSATEVLPYIFSIFKPDTIVDVGCGTGSWLKVAEDLGAKKILGIDQENIQDEFSHIPLKDRILHNLNIPFISQEKYDVALCLEVVEHLSPSVSEIIIDTLTSLSDVILFSAAIPFQGGDNHINEQWPSYWQRLFLKKGFVAVDMPGHKLWASSAIEWWYKQNMIVYVHEKKVSSLELDQIVDIPVCIREELYNTKIDIIEYLRNELKLKDAFIHKQTLDSRLIPVLKKIFKSIIKF